jgi:hypothetical protein
MKISLSGKTSCRILEYEKLWRFQNVLKKKKASHGRFPREALFFFIHKESFFLFYPVAFPIDNGSFGVVQDRVEDGLRQRAEIDGTG